MERQDEELASCYAKILKALCSVLVFFKINDIFYSGTEQGAKPSLRLEFHIPIIEKFTSAYFFVFHSQLTSSMSANEKVSASMKYQ